MTRIETEALQALVEQATPGPWAFEAHGDTGDYGVGLCFAPDDDNCERPLSGKVESDVIIEDPVAVEVNGQANATLIALTPALAAEVQESRLVIDHLSDLVAHFAAQAATAEHWRQVSVDSLVVVTGLRAELKGVKIALEQAWASNREREVELEHLRSRTEDRIHDC